MRECSLCGLVYGKGSKRASVPTKGGWVAHEECVKACPSALAELPLSAPMPDWIYPRWARWSVRLRALCERVWATDWWVARQRRKGLL